MVVVCYLLHDSIYTRRYFILFSLFSDTDSDEMALETDKVGVHEVETKSTLID